MVRDGYENMFGTGFNFRKFDGQVLILYGICCAGPKFNAVYIQCIVVYSVILV